MHVENERWRRRGVRVKTVITHFSAVYIFDSRFSEEEVDEITMGKRMHEMWS